MTPSAEVTKIGRSGKKKQPEIRAISAYSMFRGPVRVFGKPVARDILFTNHRGIYQKKIEKRQRRLLTKIPFITTFLEDGELITLITSGYAPLTRLERYLLRYLTVFRRRALFVFTDRRVFYIPTTFTYDYRYSVAEIRYANCQRIIVSGRSLLFVFHNGAVEQFPYIARRERRKLRALVGNLALAAGSPNGSQNLTYLCARCGAPIPGASASCPNCRLRFWSAAQAGKMALLIPGGGYFYMHNPLYGIAAALLELLLVILLVLSWTDLYHGLKGSIPAVILLSLALAGVKAVSFFHSRDLLQDCFPIMERRPSAR